ncbi:MAG TPA: biotin/lipoyl-containing protein [Actinomycetota bacterium]|nr:biotin/lipoyl-containing protein [Actinomycetota bacterium]
MHDSLALEHDDVVLTVEPAPTTEKVVVSPCAGRFVPRPPESFTAEGEWVEAGTVLAEVSCAGESVPVTSPFSGWVMGMLVLDGQPVHPGQALFWIWSG